MPGDAAIEKSEKAIKEPPAERLAATGFFLVFRFGSKGNLPCLAMLSFDY
jgi:hypothetical protein